ncbi:hypothetical protein [Paenibacillus oleatilyticus]|uniref:Uncharacterized protein n=1 Tax=Paenibacillus oleatilyticus TaxID=2594886 RepID=A0ABV4VCF5_9BACL
MKPLIQRQPANYQPVTGMLPPQTIREFKGVNTFDPFSITDNFFTDMSNFVTDDYPAMTVRPGYTVLGNAIGSKVLGLGVWKDQEIHAVFNDGTWRKWTGSAWSSPLASGLDTSAAWSFANFQGNQPDVRLFGANGVNGLRMYNGTSVTTFGDAPANINFISTYANRLWGASGKELRACALDQPDKWNVFNGNDEDSYGKDIESTRGENINSLSSGMSKLIVGMPNSLHELYGSNPSDFQTRLVTEETGVANNQSLFVQDSVLNFIHTNGIYRFISGGVGPDRSFSDIVKKYFLNVNNSTAGTDGKKFYFQTEPGKILVYDPRMTTWVVWTGINPTCFSIFQHQLYIGDSHGRVLRLGGLDDAGSPITWFATTKPFTSGSVAQKTRWIKLWTFWELAAGSFLNVYLSTSSEGNDWELVQTVTGTGNKIERIIIPVQKYVLANYVRIKFEGTEWARLHEHTRQVRQLPLY